MNHTGFTLVEVLIGMTLLGFILMMLYSGLYTTSRTWAAGDRQAQNNDDYRLVLSFLRTRINQIYPLFYLDDENSHILFRGETGSVSFISPLPAHRGGAGLYWLTLQVADEGGGSALVVMYEPLNPGFVPAQQNGNTSTQILIPDVASVSLNYYGKALPEDEPAWHRQWNMMGYLPDMIRLSIESADPSYQWPELHIRIPSQFERGQPQMVLLKANDA